MPSRLDRYLREMEQMQQPPVVGSTVRIESNDTEGKVVKVTSDGTVFFKTPDGRTMKTSYDNVTAVEKLADEDDVIMELSNEFLGKYKKAAGAAASKADKEGNYEKGNKRFKGIVKATKKQFDNDAKKDVSEDKWDPVTGGDFPTKWDADENDPDANSSPAKFAAMMQYHAHNAYVDRALSDLKKVGSQGLGFDSPGAARYLATIKLKLSNDTVQEYFNSKSEVYNYAKRRNGIVLDIEKIDSKDDTSDLLTLPVILGVGDHKKKWMLQFPDEDFAQRWEHRHRNVAKILWPEGHSLEQGVNENMERGVDKYGRTQQEWIKLVKTKFPNAKIIQAKMLDGPCIANLPDGRKITWKKVHPALVEGKFEYDKKSGSMKQNNEDSDQRHGLYVDGKLVKTYSTKEQADNVKKRDPKFKSATVKKIAEGSMGGINRCAPSNDVSYEKILDEVNKKWIEETSVQKLQKYQNDAASSSALNTRPLFKLAQTAKIAPKVKQKIDMKRGVTQGPAVPAGSLAEKLKYFVNEAIDKTKFSNDFADYLNRQAAEKPKPVAKPVTLKFPTSPKNVWTIIYVPISQAGQKVPYTIKDPRDKIVFQGEENTAKDAIRAAEEWITSGGGKSNIGSAKSVTIDFNVDFAREFAPEGETFYANLDKSGDTPVLIFSLVPQDGLKTSHIRTQRSKVGEETTLLPMISISPRFAEELGLQANGRYILGDKDPLDDNSAIFPLIFHSIVQGKGDVLRLGRPSITVATNRP